ncbi:MAG: hypothetical protein R2853_03085 [Thermomicrobiales bacterium]
MPRIEQVAVLAAAVQETTGQAVEVAFVDQGYTGTAARAAAAEHSSDLVAVKLAEAKRGFVLLLTRWVVEHSFAWATASGAWPKTTNSCQSRSKASFLAFESLMLQQLLHLKIQSP